MSKTGCEVACLLRRHPKKTLTSPRQHLGAVGRLLQIRSQGLQDDDRRLSAQTIGNRLHAANLRSHRAARSPAMTVLPRQARWRWCRQHVHWNLNMRGTLCSVMSPDSAYGSWIVGSKYGGDAENAMLIVAPIE
jgi:hypothetical protein